MNPDHESDRFSALFHAQYAALHRYAFTLLKNNEAASDIVQQVFTRLWEKRKNLTLEIAIKSYLYTNTRHLSLNRLRKEKNAARYMAHATRTSSYDNGQDAGSRIGESELSDQIRRTMDLLPAKCKMVFVKSRVEQKTYLEIAAEMSISVKTVEVHMGKALKIFRTALAEYLPVIQLFIFFIFPW